MRKRKRIFAFEKTDLRPLDPFDCALAASKDGYEKYNAMSADEKKELRGRAKGMSYPEMRVFLSSVGERPAALSGDHKSAVDPDHLPGDKGSVL